MRRKWTMAPLIALTAAALVGASTGISYADFSYTPTTLGNDSYTNQVDPQNDISVDGIDYTSSISQENLDTQDKARQEAVQIGTATETSTPVLVTNALDQSITEFKIRKSSEKEYGENLASAEIAAGGEAGWNLEEGDYTETELTNKNGVSAYVPDSYMIEVTLENGKTAEFHNINPAGLETVSLKYSEHYKVYYVTVTRLTQHTPDPNINYELEIKAGEEANFINNSAARYAADKEITASRGGGWDKENLKLLSDSGNFSEILDFGVYVPLYGEPSLPYTDGVYENLYWNRDLHTWRGTNGDAGTWNEATAPEGAGEYGDGDESVSNVDHHPGMDEGDWSYVTEGTAD